MLWRCRCLLQACKGWDGTLGSSTVPQLLEQVHAQLLGSSSNGSRSNSVVLLSQSQNVFENLAFEHSLFNGLRFSESDPTARVVVLYRNEPCVVVGHHQHMLLECQVGEAVKRKVQLARRYSGGGTVFHDLGNINICVLSHRKYYRPEENIKMLQSFLVSFCDETLSGSSATLHDVLKESSTSSRHDLFLEGKKVTGSAMKLGTDVAYHHFTLLVESDVDSMKGILTPKSQLRSAEYPPLPDSATGSPRKMQVGDSVNGFDTLASVSVASVPSPVTTLTDVLQRHGVPKHQMAREVSSFRFTEDLLQKLGLFAGTSFPFGGSSKTDDGKQVPVVPRLVDSHRVLNVDVSGMTLDGLLSQHLAQLRSTAWIHKNPQFLTKITVTLRGNGAESRKEDRFGVSCYTEFQAGGHCSSIAIEVPDDCPASASEALNAAVAVLNTELGSGNVNPFTLSEQDRESILSRIETHSAFSFLCGSETDANLARAQALQLAGSWLKAHQFHISGA